VGDELKSSFELAMERLKAKGGDAASRRLTAEQRARIAAIRDEFKARRAEAEVLHRSAMENARTANDAQKLLRLEEEFQREMQQLLADEERRVGEVREA
jgi:hypothetical protein